MLRIRLKRGLKHSFSGKKNAITSGGGGKKDLTASKKEQGKGVIPLKFPPCASDNILLAESAIQYSCSLCLRSTTKPFRYNRKYRLVSVSSLKRIPRVSGRRRRGVYKIGVIEALCSK